MARRSKKSPAIPQTVRMEPLEMRVLYSAEAAPLLALVDPDANSQQIHNETDPSLWDALNPNLPNANITELVLVDSSQPDIQSLLELLSSSQTDNDHIAIVTLDPNSSAIDSISDVLKRFNDLNAIHVISHASDGALKIDGELITQSTLQTNAQEVERWGEALTVDGDILLYGCNLSATAEGHAFARSLSTITSADVASSNDVTGHAIKNGDWDLEITEGEIETESAIAPSVQDDWTGSLDITSGLVHHYNFQNDGTDQTGSAHASLINNVSFEQGQVRLAAAFDADSGGLKYAEINSADLTNFDTGYFSVAMWVRTTDSGTENTLMSNMQTSTNGFMLFTDDAGEVTFYIEDESDRDVTSNVSINDGNWYHIAATRGFEGLYLRISDSNGVLIDDEYNYSIRAGELNVDSVDNLGIGANSGGAVTDYDGNIDDIRIYHRDLSLTDVDDIVALADAPQQQSVLNNNRVTLDNNTSAVITSDDLLTVDKESDSTDIQYRIISDIPEGLQLRINGTTIVDNGDYFTQAVIDAGVLEIVADITPTSSTPQSSDYAFSFQVSDPDSNPTLGTFQVTVDVEANTPPTIDSVGVPPSISEATPVGTIIGGVNTSDIDGDTVTVTVESPSDEYFGIDSNNNIVLINPINYETNNTIAVNISASDDYGSTSSSSIIPIDDENDAPVTYEAILQSIDEDTANPQGMTVGDLYNSTFSDEDAGDTFGGIAISSNYPSSSSEGRYEYSTDRINWQPLGNVSYVNALVLSPSTYIRFDPINNYYGKPDNVWAHAIDSNYSLDYSTNETKVYIDVSSATDYGSVDRLGSLFETEILPVNDSPQAPTTSLPSIQEDSSNSSGSTLASIYETIFSDTDANTNRLAYYDTYGTGSFTGDTFAGVVVTRHVLDPNEGIWEYSTDDTNWHALGAVSNTQALALSAETAIRFTPADDFEGMPNNVSIRVLDNSWTGGFTDGANRLEVDTTNRPSNSPMSSGNPSLNIEVTAVNDAPVANDDSLPVGEGDTATINLISNDTDIENDNLSIDSLLAPSYGTISIVGAGIVEYQHDGSTSTSDTFQYRITDGESFSEYATVTVNVTPANDAPEITTGSFISTISESAVVGTALGNVNVSDEEGDPFTLSIESPENAILEINDSNQVILTGELDYETSDTLDFVIRATDTEGQFDTYSVSIAIENANEAPSISSASLSPIDEDSLSTGETISSLFADSFTDVDEGASLIGVAIDSNAGGTENGFWHYKTEEPFWHQIYSPTENGALVLRADDIVRFRPGDNYNGTPTPLTLHALDNGYTGAFTDDSNRVLLDVANPEEYGAVSLSGVELNAIITPVNDLPVAVDDNFNATEDTFLNGNVILNDSDADEEPFTASLISLTSEGTITSFNPDGSFTYTHNQGPATTDSFTYQLSDGTGDSNVATATINITTSNDAPTIEFIFDIEGINESSTAGAFVASIAVSDIDLDDVTLSITSPENNYLMIDDSHDIRLVAPIDHETQASLTFGVKADDGNGGFDSDSFTLPVEDANEAPSISTATPMSVNEDETNPLGESVSSLFGGSFTDIDSGASFTGIAIDGNYATISEGAWQYSSDGGAQWYNIDNRSNETALALSESTLVRFLPAADFNGEPGPLTVHALDNGYIGAFTDGASIVTLDTNNRPEFGFMSIAGVRIQSNVVGINDAPVFDAVTLNSTINESDSVGSVIGQIEVSDNENDAIALSLDSAAEFYFDLNAANEIIIKTALNYESTASIPMTITATDANGDSTYYSTTALIQDNNEAPTVATVVVGAIEEDDTNPPGAIVNSLFSSSFSDVDAGAFLSGIAITDNPLTIDGEWQYSINGTTWIGIGATSGTNAFVIAEDTLIRFLPSTDYNGTPSPLSVRALDNGYSGGFSDGITDVYIDTSTAQTFGAISETDERIMTAVTAANDLPVAVNDAFSTDEDVAINGIVISNDYDVDGDTVIASLESEPSNGTLTFSANGSFTYSHNQGTDTTDSFTYMLSDGTGNSNVATVNISINTTNDAPTIESVPLIPEANESLAIGSVVGSVNASDLDGDTLSFSIDSPANSFLTINESNQIVTTVALDYETQPSIAFVITASDENGGFDTANVTLNIANVNEAPSIANAALSNIDEDDTNPFGTSVAALYSGSFTDIDADAQLAGIAITSNSMSANGQWQYSVDGTNWNDVGATTPSSALVLEANHELRFLPSEHYNGTPAPLGVRALDNIFAGEFSSIAGPAFTDVTTAEYFGAIALNDAELSTSVIAANDSPQFSSVDIVSSISETTAVGTVLGNVTTTDVDGDEVSLSIDSPADTYLSVNSANEIVLNNVVDHETQASIAFVISATDNNGGITQHHASIQVSDAYESPAIAPATLGSVEEDNENPAGETIVNLFSVGFTDTDNDAQLSGIAISENNISDEGEWQYSEDGQAWFNIGSVSPTSAISIEATSSLRFLPSENYYGAPSALSVFALDDNFSGEFSNSTSVHIDVNAPEYSGTISTQAVTLTTEVVSVNDVPFLIQPTSPLSINENAAAGTQVGAVQAIDVDHTALQFSLINDTGGRFTIDADSGSIAVASDAQLDFEVNESHIITIRVSDTDNGFSDTELIISVDPENEPPLLDAIEASSLEFIENDSAKAISNSITVTEPDNDTIESARISFISGFDAAQDQLIFQDTTDITGQFDSLNGVLTLSGTSHSAAYQDAIRSVLYLNSSENPSTTTRVIEISVNDDANSSNIVSREINVVSVNDEASLIANEGATIEPNGSVVITSDMLNVADVDNDPSSIVYSKSTVWSSTLLLVNGQAAETFTQQDVDLGIVEIISTESSAGSIVLPLFVNDDGGQPLSFDMILSVTQTEPITEPPAAALGPTPIEFIQEATLNAVERPNSIPANLQANEQTETSSETQTSDGDEVESSTSNGLEKATGDITEESLSIAIPEQLENTKALDLTALANELSEPEQITKKHKTLSAKAAVELQLASLLSLEPISIDYSGDFKLKQSENMLTRSIETMEEQLARTAEKHQNNTTVQDSIAGFTVSLTAGFLIWALRGGALMASMLSISPLWKQLDPLAIMSTIKGSKSVDAESKEDEEVEDLFTK